MKKKKIIKLVIIGIIILIIVILGFLIYKEIFQSGESKRLENIENYILTKDEIESVKEKFNEIEDLKSVEVSKKHKIIKIYLEFNECSSFTNLKKISNESLSKISDKNLSFYDIEIFVTSVAPECEKYPKIGYKHKSNSEFTWNRW